MMTADDLRGALARVSRAAISESTNPSLSEVILDIVGEHFPAESPYFQTQIEAAAGYKLSKNQLQFVADCVQAGLEPYYTYSGRGMFGKNCPAVNLDGLDNRPNTISVYCTDTMGLGEVWYARY